MTTNRETPERTPPPTWSRQHYRPGFGDLIREREARRHAEGEPAQPSERETR